jgi:hypothetical protein
MKLISVEDVFKAAQNLMRLAENERSEV